MPESLTPELLALRDATDALARDTLAPLATEFPAHRKRIIEASKAAGLFFMTQPKALGGSQASALAMTVARDTLASHNLSHLPVFGPGPGVLAGAGEPVASSHLAPLIAGEKRDAFGFTEPDNAVRPTRGRIVGGSALTVGHPLETLYRRVRAMRLAEGANDILRLNLARGRLHLEKGRI